MFPVVNLRWVPGFSQESSHDDRFGSWFLNASEGWTSMVSKNSCLSPRQQSSTCLCGFNHDLPMIYLWFTYDLPMINHDLPMILPWFTDQTMDSPEDGDSTKICWSPHFSSHYHRLAWRKQENPANQISASHSLSENRAPKSQGVSSASQFLMTIICGIAQVFRQIHMNPIEVMAVACLSNIFMASRQWVARQKNVQIVPLAMRQRYKPATNFRVCVSKRTCNFLIHPSKPLAFL